MKYKKIKKKKKIGNLKKTGEKDFKCMKNWSFGQN
jgi:hypothetical protein